MRACGSSRKVVTRSKEASSSWSPESVLSEGLFFPSFYRSGPQLHLGGHDYFPMDSSQMNGETVQTTVKLDHHVTFPSETYHLLTATVNETHATFYQDITLLGVQRIPRPLTDCFSNEAKLLVGDADMEVGQLRFYPDALTPANIEEIFGFGSTLADISTVALLIVLAALALQLTQTGLRCARSITYML